MPVHIRALEEVDFSRGFLDTLGNLAPVELSVEEALIIWKERSAAGIHSVVAEADGRVVGTASLIVEKKYIHRGGVAGHIEDVVVHRDYLRRGIGKQMVEYLTKLAATLDCYKVTLNCHDHLVPFYGQIGYRRYDNGMRCDLNK